MRAAAPSAWRDFARDERGTALIEFAFAVPILAMLVLGTADFARAVAFQQNLEEITSRALERATAVGNVKTASEYTTAYEAVREDAIEAADVTTDDVTMERWLECDGTKQTDYDAECPTGQQIARFVSLEVRKSYQPLFDLRLLGPVYGSTGISDGIPMKGDGMVRIQ